MKVFAVGIVHLIPILTIKVQCCEWHPTHCTSPLRKNGEMHPSPALALKKFRPAFRLAWWMLQVASYTLNLLKRRVPPNASLSCIGTLEVFPLVLTRMVDVAGGILHPEPAQASCAPQRPRHHVPVRRPVRARGHSQTSMP